MEPNLLLIMNQVQDEIAKSVASLADTSKIKDRKTIADTILSLTKTYESITDSIIQMNDIFEDEDDEDEEFWDEIEQDALAKVQQAQDNLKKL